MNCRLTALESLPVQHFDSHQRPRSAASMLMAERKEKATMDLTEEAPPARGAKRAREAQPTSLHSFFGNGVRRSQFDSPDSEKIQAALRVEGPVDDAAQQFEELEALKREAAGARKHKDTKALASIGRQFAFRVQAGAQAGCARSAVKCICRALLFPDEAYCGNLRLQDAL